MKYLMECGHVANAFDADGKPICIICYGTRDGYDKVVNEIDCNNDYVLKGRHARCLYCNRTVDSSWKLPFFEYFPNKICDEYYCGCGGWD